MNPRLLKTGLLAAGLVLAGRPLLPAQSGQFVIPVQRAENGTRFSYWDIFAQGASYNIDHFPSLLNTPDAEDNLSNYNTNASLRQVIAGAQAFVTGSGAIYSFRTETGFEMRYTHTGTEPVAGVVFQTITGGTPLLPESFRLRCTPAGGGEPVLLAPDFRARDVPGTGQFLERELSGFEWDLTGLNVQDYTLVFESEGPHMAFYEAQLDTTTGSAFTRELGWLLTTRALPVLRAGVPGFVERNLPGGTENRFFIPGSEVPLDTVATGGFEAVGWVLPDGTVRESPDPITVMFDPVAPVDLGASAIFSPSSWTGFRTAYFDHFNELIETEDDYTNDAVSAMDVDHDKDGLNNFSEYAMGGDPYRPDADVTAPVPSLIAVEGTAYPALTYRRRAAADSDLTYVVEQSSTLGSWTSGTVEAPATVPVSTRLETDGTRLVTVRSTTPAGSTPLFLRVRATLTPP